MLKRKLALLASVLVVMFGAAGCLDLFSVPGIALSPDGNQIVFLSGFGQLLTEEDEEMETQFDLVSANLSDGATTTLYSPDENTLVTAFDINPTNGDVAFTTATKEGATTIQIYSAGSIRELVSAANFGASGIGTMMAYSPDGSKIALTMVTMPPEMLPKVLENDEDEAEMTDEEAKAFNFVAYVVDVNSGTITPISSTTERANTVTWNPSSTQIVYNAWVDSDGDGIIATVPDAIKMRAGQPIDNSQLVLYDVASSTSKVIGPLGVNFSPVFLSDAQVGFSSIDPTKAASDATAGSYLNVYDIASDSTQSTMGSLGGIYGLSLSPDGSKIAWIESAPSAEDPDNTVYIVVVANPDFSDEQQVIVFDEEVALPDQPIWTPDGSAVLISVTNALAQIPQQISASFSSSGESSVETEGGAPAQVFRVDIATGESTPVFSGAMINSSFFTGLFGLATSGSMESMLGGD